MSRTEDTTGTDDEVAPLVAASVAESTIGLALVLQWLVPGAGYLVLGRKWRAVAAAAGILFMCTWGLALDGELSRPQPNMILSYLKTFACFGLGLVYVVGRNSEALHHGLGDITRQSSEIGNTFIWAGGLLAYLLLLDVYDIAVGRKL